MKRIGLVIAVEIQAFNDRYGEPDEIIWIRKQKVRKYIKDTYELYVMQSGAGEIAAASTTQFLISEFDVEIILNYGVVGGLTEEISKSRICVVKDVVHYDFDTSAADQCEVGRYLNYPSVYLPTTEQLWKEAVLIAPELKPVRCASGDKFIADAKDKKRLAEYFNADICEMEAAGIVLTCNRNDIPCLLIKMVADGITGGAEEYHREALNSAKKCLEVFEKVIENL